MGQSGEVHIIWTDPVGVIVSNYVMKLEGGWFVSYHKPKLVLPIRPGVWSVKLEIKHGPLLMQTKFLVVPLTHENKKSLASPQSINAQKIGVANQRYNSEAYDKWRNNVSKSGHLLEQWLDELVGMYWTLDSYCWTNAPTEISGLCTWMEDCKASNWSTFFPDPKSEIGAVQRNGKIR